MGGANIQIVHYFGHGYLEEEKSMIRSFTVIFGANYVIGMVTSIPPSETFSLIKHNILHQSKNYKNHFENSNFWGMWPRWSCDIQFRKYAVHINGDFWWSKVRPQIVSEGTTANSLLNDSLHNQVAIATRCILFINTCTWNYYKIIIFVLTTHAGKIYTGL